LVGLPRAEFGIPIEIADELVLLMLPGATIVQSLELQLGSRRSAAWRLPALKIPSST
jgi:hypothetical protein